MSQKIKAIRGMDDILPVRTPIWQYMEGQLRSLLNEYGYKEIRFPIVEKTELFKRSIGEVTDIVEKEMYTFEDRNGESLTLRPEGTAGCVRAGEEHGLLYNQTQRLWYTGPMFRYEKPQKGRYRQFHQFGAEAFGFAGPDIDAEMIAMTARLWQRLGLQDRVTLQLNSLGSIQARAEYKSALVDYLKGHERDLDEDSQRRLSSNPLRILDSKSESTQRILEQAPCLSEYLDEESSEHFAQLQALLQAAAVPFELNPRLVRGLDYYGKTVFEWVTKDLGAQGTVCAGGRYDGLVEQLGGKPTPAVGFAIGLERLELLLQQQLDEGQFDTPPQVYVVSSGSNAMLAAFGLIETLRTQAPGIRAQLHCGGGKFKKQMKKADESGAQLALIIGEQEVENQVVQVKFLREQRDQQEITWADVGQYLIGILN